MRRIEPLDLRSNAGHVAEPPRGLGMRRVDGHAAGDERFGRGLEVIAQLVVEIRLRVRPDHAEVAAPLGFGTHRAALV